jgi:ABC-type transport system substrate-binding protein
MSLRGLTQALILALACGTALAQKAGGGDAPRVLRYAFPIAETGFDPVQLSDLYSRTVTAGIFEAPLAFDFLARPFAMKPLTAAEMPTISDDFRSFTFRLKPGIYFADDPAFKGQRRELVAQDYVYTIKRHYDPRWNSPNLYLLENARLLGLSELRKQVLKDKTSFPYDQEVEGARALDRYTFQIRLAAPSPRFHQQLMTDNSVFGAMAREVVEAYGDKIMAHPVGTGPYRLAEWRRSSRIVLERNPGFREMHYDEQAPADDARSQAIAARLKGRRLPMLDRVEISIIEESQPRWLSFLNAQSDVMERLPNEFAPVVIPNDRLAPNLARQGVTMDRAPLADVTLAALFNQDNPVVGGYTPEKVALRRAIALGYDSGQEIRLVRKAQAIPAQTAIAPMTFGYNPALKTSMSDHDPARARALLDLYGYVDRDGDGWREAPDGTPLTLEYSTQPDQLSRQLAELWEKSMKAIGLRIVFKVAKWPENLKASRAGKLMMWGVGWLAGSPDGDTFLALAYGPNKGGANHARFDLPAFNELYIQQNKMPDGPERQRVMEEASKLMVAYVPYKMSSHRIATDLMHPWVIGFRRNPFVREFYKYVDVDPALRAREAK